MAVQEVEDLSKNAKTKKERMFWQKAKYVVAGVVVLALVIQMIRDVKEMTS